MQRENLVLTFDYTITLSIALTRLFFLVTHLNLGLYKQPIKNNSGISEEHSL
mgnify:CR=1 FL=1